MLEKVNININIDDNLFDNLLFSGHYFGLYIDDELVVTVPFFPEQKINFKEYKETVRTSLSLYGKVAKVALYVDSRTGCYYALPQSKKYSYLLNTAFNIRNGVSTNLPYSEKQVPMSLIKEDTSNEKFIGVVKKHNSGTYSCLPFVIFNHKKIDQSIELELISLATYLGCGNFIEGTSKRSSNYKGRKFNPSYIPNELFFLKNTKSLPFSHEVTGRFKSKQKKIFFCNRLVNKTLFIGDQLDPDWFGREFGFWAFNEDQQIVRFHCLSNTDKGFHCPINEL
ncbi:hypothetical protein [Acinetobacter terrae]|nr:hypothetical protein [Acinetobacter terrae]